MLKIVYNIQKKRIEMLIYYFRISKTVYISWWPAPQYSLHTTRYFPASCWQAPST
jgi:hypothetical protein